LQLLCIYLFFSKFIAKRKPLRKNWKMKRLFKVYGGFPGGKKKESSEACGHLIPVTFKLNPSTRLDNSTNF